MRDSSELQFAAAVDAAARLMYDRTMKSFPSLNGTEIPAFDDLTPIRRFEYQAECLEILKVAAPYFAAQGWEIGYGNGDGDSRIVGSDYYENPWGEYAPE